MDIKNTPIQHLIVVIFTLLLVFIFRYLLQTEWAATFARISFILLFLTLAIGPVMKLKAPKKSSSPLQIPWSWRGELGIWFAITGLIHFIILIMDRPFSTFIKIGGSGYGLANLIGLIALVLALLLAFTSLNKIILFLGIKQWKWLHSFTYVVFYLVSLHLIYFQFFSTYGEVGPDWFGYTAIVLAIIILLLQSMAFIKTVADSKKSNII